MLKSTTPRCDRQYTFYDSNGEFTICPISVNKEWQIVFWNFNTANSVNYTLKEFSEMYENNLVSEKIIEPKFMRDKQIRNSNKFYAVARGRLDFFITYEKYFLWPVVWDFDGACYGEFDNFGDAMEFLRTTDERLPESARLIESSLTEVEHRIIEHYRTLSKAEKKIFCDKIFIDK